ncbi:hypothetical protein YC2023_001164 [Brassica napus]
MHLTFLGFKSALPFVYSFLVLSVLLDSKRHFRLVLGARSNLLSSLQVTIGLSVWSWARLIAFNDFAGMALVLACALLLPPIQYVLFSCRCESVTAKAGESFVCKGYQLLPAPLSIVGDWSSWDCFLVFYHYQ